MTLLRLLLALAVLPGRLLITWLNARRRGNSVSPLNGFQRGAVHGSVWLALIVLAMTTGPTPTTRPAASVQTPTPVPARVEPVRQPDPAALIGESVVRVIDGDTFELADGRRVRVLGIDSCESDTPGGADATAKARELLLGSVGLRAEPGVDKDGFGRLLRYVQTRSGDFGQAMVGYDHTGVYQGRNDASSEYVERLYAHDRDHATVPPPSGRECGSYPPPPVVDRDDTYVPIPDNDDDRRDRNGRFCGRFNPFC